MKAYSGFTLLELLITLAVAGIMFAMAMPSFNQYLASKRVTVVADSLRDSLFEAQKSAMSGRAISSKVINVKSASDAKDWSDGWDVKGTGTDEHNSKGRLKGEGFRQEDSKVSVTELSSKGELSFNVHGAVNEIGGGKFIICHEDYEDLTKIIEVTRAGIIRLRAAETEETCSTGG